jgi:hypothetical protein
MRSHKQIQASRANGARPKRPVTASGKQAASRDSVRPNISARTHTLSLRSETRTRANVHRAGIPRGNRANPRKLFCETNPGTY